MTKQDFAEEFALILNVPTTQLEETTNLRAIPTWDSVAYLATMVMIDEKLGIALRADAIRGVNSFGDLLNLVSEKFS